MRWAWAVLTVAACNDVYGLGDTRLYTAPTSCPPIGTPPHYAPRFAQMLVADCDNYTPSSDAGFALAGCANNGTEYIGAGAIGDDLGLTDIPARNKCVNLNYARLAPEGDRAYVDDNNFDCLGNDSFAEYVATDPMHWTYVGDSGIPPSTDGTGEELGSFTYGPDRHAMVVSGTDGTLHEWVLQGTSWHEILPAYVGPELGLRASSINGAPNLTPDGLRLVFQAVGADGAAATFYMDRPAIDARFTVATPLAGVPGDVYDAYLTPDCTRVYFSGLGRIFYLEEQ